MYDFYHRMIVEPGRQPLFLLLIAFVVTFLFIRFSVRMIRFHELHEILSGEIA